MQVPALPLALGAPGKLAPTGCGGHMFYQDKADKSLPQQLMASGVICQVERTASGCYENCQFVRA